MNASNNVFYLTTKYKFKSLPFLVEASQPNSVLTSQSTFLRTGAFIRPAHHHHHNLPPKPRTYLSLHLEISETKNRTIFK